MSLFYVTRPSDEPSGWDSQRGQPFYQYTRYRGLQQRRDRAINLAKQVRGRAYEYDGEHRLIYDAQRPDNVREDARATARIQARADALAGSSGLLDELRAAGAI